MEGKTSFILGAIFILASGFTYTLERGFSMLSTSLVKAGFFSGQMSGEVPSVEVNGFFSNLFTPLFLLIGIILIIYSSEKMRMWIHLFYKKYLK